MDLYLATQIKLSFLECSDRDFLRSTQSGSYNEHLLYAHTSKRVHVCRCLKHTLSRPSVRTLESDIVIAAVCAHPLFSTAGLDDSGRNDYKYNNDRVCADVALVCKWILKYAHMHSPEREWSFMALEETERNFFGKCCEPSAQTFTTCGICARTFYSAVIKSSSWYYFCTSQRRWITVATINSQFCCLIFLRGSRGLTGFGIAWHAQAGGYCVVKFLSCQAIIAPNGVF